MSIPFARTAVLPATLAASLLLGACANMNEEQKGTAQGAGIGVVAGAGAVLAEVRHQTAFRGDFGAPGSMKSRA